MHAALSQRLISVGVIGPRAYQVRNATVFARYAPVQKTRFTSMHNMHSPLATP